MSVTKKLELSWSKSAHKLEKFYVFDSLSLRCQKSIHYEATTTEPFEVALQVGNGIGKYFWNIIKKFC